jgi:polyferredoxin
MIASRSWILPLALGGIVLLLTVMVGRAWCSWLCPLGTLLDWTPSRRPKRNKLDTASYWRQIKYGVLFAILIAAALGSLTLLILDPITLLVRTLAGVVLPGLSSILITVESALYSVEALKPAVEWFDGIVRGVLITEQPFYLPNIAIGVVFVGVLALNAVRSRFWCRYLCPLGGLLALVGRLPFVRHKVDEAACIACQQCVTSCSTGAIDPQRGFVVDNSECTTCLECMEICPTHAISFSVKRKPVIAPDYNPSRRQFVWSLGAGVIGAALIRVVPSFIEKVGVFIRPPGTDSERILSQCIRCGECIKVCPTGTIQPSSRVDRLEAVWTPVVIPRLGYCDYSCNSCGQVCPTEAIPALPLEEKRHVRMGTAYIDTKRCIPWADCIDCIVCEEACPVPQKAIKLENKQIVNDKGEMVTVLLPRVMRGLCIGCGYCEYQCPVNGEAAIRVHAAGQTDQPGLGWRRQRNS